MIVPVVYVDEQGVEYVSVPLPTHEVTDAVPIGANRRRTVKEPLPVYAGTDGPALAAAPRTHRKRWTDEQWIAFREHQKLESELARDDEPVAAAIVVRMP